MKILLIALVAPVLLSAQTDGQKPTPPVTVTRMVRVQYGNPQTIAYLASAGLNVSANADNTLRAVVIKGSSDLVTEVVRVIHELDVPASLPISKDIEVTVSVLGASSKPAAFAQGGELPQSLAPVVKQIGAIFPYKSYQLVSSMLMRSREGGKSENQGVIQGVSGDYESPYKLSYDEATASTSDGKPLLHLRNFRFTAFARIPAGPQSFQTSDIGLLADIDLREGEKVVVGKASTGDGDSALFVILSGRLAD
jgi:hypothetical protein